MLVLPLLCFIFSICFSELFFFPIFLSFSFLFILLSFSSFNNVFSSCGLFVFDSFRIMLLLLTMFVLYISYLASISFNTRTVDFILFLIYVPCLFVFSSSNLLILYLFYELSLVPIVYIIVKWGSYPERSLSALMLLLYTSLFSFPLIGGLFYVYSSVYSFFLMSCSLYSFSPRVSISILVFLAFSVKLPIYGLHFWLPIAHVEAPTFGSIILAGILLKLGGVGLIRFLPLIRVPPLKSFIFAYSLFFLAFSSLLCCFQSDFKRLVAYSSISHIIAIPILVLLSSYLSVKTALFLIVFHGISSPILFCLVGILYSLYSTRQLALMRGLLIISPLLTLLSVITFFFTLSAPPYPSFLSEILFFLSSLSAGRLVLPFLLLFAFLSLVYNLNWLSSILFNSPSLINISFSFSFLPLFIICLSHTISFVFIFLSFYF